MPMCCCVWVAVVCSSLRKLRLRVCFPIGVRELSRAMLPLSALASRCLLVHLPSALSACALTRLSVCCASSSSRTCLTDSL